MLTSSSYGVPTSGSVSHLYDQIHTYLPLVECVSSPFRHQYNRLIAESAVRS